MKLAESGDIDGQRLVLVELVAAAFEELAKLQNQFPGFANIDIDDIELLVKEIFALRGTDDAFTLTGEGNGRVDLCKSIGVLHTSIASILSSDKDVSQSNIAKYRGLGFDSILPPLGDKNVLHYQNTPVEMVRGLMGVYLLLIHLPASSFEVLEAKIRDEQDLDRPVFTALRNGTGPGSYEYQLWLVITQTKSKYTSDGTFQEGLRALWPLIKQQRDRFKIETIEEIPDPAAREEIIFEDQRAREKYMLEKDLERRGLTMDQMPTEAAMRKLFEADFADDIVEILTPIIEALGVRLEMQKSTDFGNELLIWFNEFDNFNDTDTSYEALLWEALYWVSQARKTVFVAIAEPAQRAA